MNANTAANTANAYAVYVASEEAAALRVTRTAERIREMSRGARRQTHTSGARS